MNKNYAQDYDIKFIKKIVHAKIIFSFEEEKFQ